MKIEDIRKELGVGSKKSKARESRLRWFGHVQVREQESKLRQMIDREIPRRRPRGKPRGRWRDLLGRDMRELRVVPEDADDRNIGDDGSGPPTPPQDKAREVKKCSDRCTKGMKNTKKLIIDVQILSITLVNFYLFTQI